MGVVGSREPAAPQQWNLHDLEEILAHLMLIHVAARRNAAISAGLRARKINRAVTGTERQQWHMRESRGGNPGYRFDALRHLLVQSRQPFILVTDQARLDGEQ